MAENPSGLFRVICAPVHLEFLKNLARKAVRLGLGAQFLAELNSIENHLEKDPLTWLGRSSLHIKKTPIARASRVRFNSPHSLRGR